ncbi:DMT family transporter [Longispora sp. NPDC051575]|uniref:DMT family transporter n=1 Tax=Longispora sp. NPDC051575 TaxID=3154943 RepID=UPI003434C4D7
MAYTAAEPRTTADWRTGAAVVVTVLAWASAFISIRSAGQYFTPGALALGRMLVATVAVMALLLIRREGWPARGAWPGIVTGGLLWFGVYMVALNWAEQKVDAGTAAMVVNIGPIIIALMSGLLLREGFPRPLMIGMAVSFAGAVVVGYSQSRGGDAPVLGVLLCVVAAVTYACGVVVQKPALRYASASQVTAFSCLVATIACLPFSGQLLDGLGSAPASATVNMVYLGLVPTALAFTTWAYALARTTAGKMGATTYVVPAIVVFMSWLFLSEVPGWWTVAGGLLCLAGVAVARRGSSRRPAAVPAARPDHGTD